MNIRIEIKGNKAYIYTPYNKEFIKRVKMIGDASWRGVHGLLIRYLYRQFVNC